MAGDWIKMRGDIPTHPKFLRLCARLIHGDEEEVYGFALYVCGADALGVGLMPPSNESVTERALRSVTERALRDVIHVTLMRVWHAVNSHCLVRNEDAVMRPMTMDDLNEVAGFEGFGEAMKLVGWVVEEDLNTLVFPNFREFNEPACLRKRPKTNAERQREFRERNRAEDAVTKVTKRNDREEKRREEKNINTMERAQQGEETPTEGGETPPAAPTARRPDFVGFADAWASLERWCRRGSRFGLPVGHDTERVILTLRDALEQQPPIIHGDQPVNQWLLVPLAVESLTQDGTAFTSIDYACKCVKNRLDEWAKNGIHKENGNGQSRAGNNPPPRRRRPGEAVDAGMRL